MKIASRFHRLDQATNIEFMTALFTKYLGQVAPGSAALDDLQIPRLFPQPNDSFVIQYDLTVRMTGADQSQRLMVGGVLSGSGNEMPGTIILDENIVRCEDIPLVLVVFPHDPSLPGLRQLAKELRLPDSIETAVIEHLQADKSISISEILPLGWRPGRRAVVKISVGYNRQGDSEAKVKDFIVKLLRPRKTKKLFGRIDKLSQLVTNDESPIGFEIPEIHAFDPITGMIVMTAVTGKNLYQLIGEDRFGSGCRQAGCLLRDLHGLEGADLPAHTWVAELDSTRLTCERTSVIFPESARPINDRLEELYKLGGMAIESSEQSTIHRDFYDRQVIPGQSRPTLLDLDNLSLGDPAQDVGNFLAHLYLRGQQYPRAKNLLREGETAFLEGYGSSDNEFRHRLEIWKRITLVRLTCLYLLRPKWRGLALGLLRADQAGIKEESST